MSEPRLVPATEYDALCDLLAEITRLSTLDVIGLKGSVAYTLGDDAAAWFARIVIDGDQSYELFPTRRAA